MASHHLKTLVVPSAGKRIAASLAAATVLLLVLACVAFRLLVPVHTGAGSAQEGGTRGTDATSVSLLVSRTHARVAQYALSASVDDEKAAEDSLALLDRWIAMTTVSGHDAGTLAALAGRYRASVESTFAAVAQRRDSIDRMLSAGTEIRTIASAIVLALDDETDADLIRSGMALAQSFAESDAAAARFLASRTPADSNIAARTLATVPIEVARLARLGGENLRIRRFVAAMEQPLAVYAKALQDVVAVNERLRLEARRA